MYFYIDVCLLIVLYILQILKAFIKNNVSYVEFEGDMKIAKNKFLLT